MESLTEAEAEALLNDWRFWARPDQLPPTGDWFVWLLLAGRGFGKTRTGAEWVLSGMRETPGSRWALVARKLDEVRTTMVEGESGILAIMPEDLREQVKWNRSTCELFLPDGSLARGYASEEPKNLRGPQHHGAWCDELAQWKDAASGAREDTTWSNLMLGLRLGDNPRCVVTTTPKVYKLVKDILALPDVAVTRGTTYDNLPNLAPSFRATILRQFEGTRLGRQELMGELLEDAEGALWTRAMIDDHRVDEAPQTLSRVVVAVDPAVTSSESSDQTGIVVAGRAGDHAYILADATGPATERLTPSEWAHRCVAQYDKFNADRIIGEVNNGGDLVEVNVRTARATVPFEKVHASRGKAIRAQPVSALYEQGRVHHVGTLPELEDQLCTWEPELDKSPDRLDALVWAVTALGLTEQQRKPAIYAR